MRTAGPSSREAGPLSGRPGLVLALGASLILHAIGAATLRALGFGAADVGPPLVVELVDPVVARSVIGGSPAPTPTVANELPLSRSPAPQAGSSGSAEPTTPAGREGRAVDPSMELTAPATSPPLGQGGGTGRAGAPPSMDTVARSVRPDPDPVPTEGGLRAMASVGAPPAPRAVEPPLSAPPDPGSVSRLGGAGSGRMAPPPGPMSSALLPAAPAPEIGEGARGPAAQGPGLASTATRGVSALGAGAGSTADDGSGEGLRGGAASVAGPGEPGLGTGSVQAALSRGDGGLPPEYEGYVRALRQRIQERLAYPEGAIRRRLQGTVEIEILVDPAGRIQQVRSAGDAGNIGPAQDARDGGSPLLRDAAIRAAREAGPLPFPPGLPPRSLRIRLPVVFQLR